MAETEREARAIAVEAYVYLFPLVLMEVSRRQATNGPAGVRPAFGPMGQFNHLRAFPPGDFRAVVRPNFDTLYSSAWLDLRAEPVIVSVPDTGRRYYLLPALDMWTDVFAVPGSRTTGTGAGHFAFALPGWQGALPAGVELIRAPTSFIWIIGRTQTNGPADYPAVHAIQDGIVATPLSRWGRPPAAIDPHSDPAIDMETAPLEQTLALPAADYFGLAARLLELHPPHATDFSILARMRRIGLGPGAFAPAPEQRAAIDAAPAEALALMRATLPHAARVTNGWQISTETIGVYGNAYLKRAIIALGGLGANPPEDAVYPLGVTDADGEPTTGERDYVLHFEAGELPPVDAFWSVTLYDADGFTVPNALERYALGDRDDLHFGDDGSLDLYVSHESPGAEHEVNWLPAPPGPIGLTMRLYAPEPQVLDGRWSPPPLRRVA